MDQDKEGRQSDRKLRKPEKSGGWRQEREEGRDEDGCATCIRLIISQDLVD